MKTETLGRFGHHPDPAIDFEVEVEEIIGMAHNRRVGFDAEPTLDDRVEKAMGFKVGGVETCVTAKSELRKIDAELRAAVASRPVPAVAVKGDWDREVDDLVQSIAEWDDRTSPDDYPDHLLLTPKELKEFARDVASLAPATRAVPAETTRQVAWLIERNEDIYPAKHPRWYAERFHGWHWWTEDANEAKRFASRAEAEAFPAYQMIADDPEIDITEHVLLALAPTDEGAAITEGIAKETLREKIEKLTCRGSDNGVALVSLNAVLAAVDEATPASQPVVVTEEMVNAAWNKGKALSMTGLPEDFRQVLEAADGARSDGMMRALQNARDFIEHSAFNVPKKGSFEAVLKDIDDALDTPEDQS